MVNVKIPASQALAGPYSLPRYCSLNEEGRQVGASNSKSPTNFGFLTVVEDDEQGWLGGYLLLNAASRPLEFHCTAPVKPNRAQQILYGPTLAPFVCGEQIGAALARKATTETAVIFTDVAAMMALRGLVEVPVVEICHDNDKATSAPSGDSSRKLRIDNAHEGGPPSPASGRIAFQLGQRQVAVSADFAGDQQRVLEILDAGPQLDLEEPFERIREAIDETQLRKR